MSQQINLFNPLFLKKKRHFSAATMAQAFGVLVVGLAAFYGYARYKETLLKVEAESATRAFEAEKARLSKFTAEFAPGKGLSEIEKAIETAIKTILLLHGIILSFGGIPLLYYGDAIGMLNSLEYLADPNHRLDTRWAHRSCFDWNKAEKRHKTGTVEYRIFSVLKKMIALRKETSAFADFDNRQLLAVENQNLLAFIRTDPQNSRNKVLVLGNFSVDAQVLQISSMRTFGLFQQASMRNICTGAPVVVENDAIIIPALCCYWLTD